MTMRRLRMWMVAAVLALGLEGCGALARTGERLDARDVTAAIERRLQVRIGAQAPPSTGPGLPALAATYSGAAGGQRIVLLDFFTAEGTRAALGALPRLDRAQI